MKLPATVDGPLRWRRRRRAQGYHGEHRLWTSASPLDMFVMKQAIVYLAPFVLTTILALFQCVRRCVAGPTMVALDQFVASVMVVPTCCTRRWSNGVR